MKLDQMLTDKLAFIRYQYICMNVSVRTRVKAQEIFIVYHLIHSCIRTHVQYTFVYNTPPLCLGYEMLKKNLLYRFFRSSNK